MRRASQKQIIYWTRNYKKHGWYWSPAILMGMFGIYYPTWRTTGNTEEVGK